MTHFRHLTQNIRRKPRRGCKKGMCGRTQARADTSPERVTISQKKPASFDFWPFSSGNCVVWLWRWRTVKLEARLPRSSKFLSPNTEGCRNLCLSLRHLFIFWGTRGILVRKEPWQWTPKLKMHVRQKVDTAADENPSLNKRALEAFGDRLPPLPLHIPPPPPRCPGKVSVL